jgi:hypothetical protein
MEEAREGHDFLYPLVPADAGTQALPHRTSMQFGKVWIPAGVYPRESGGGNERMWQFLHPLLSEMVGTMARLRRSSRAMLGRDTA